MIAPLPPTADEFLEQLVSAYSPSRNEAPAAMYALEVMQMLGFEGARIDEVGNVLGSKGKSGAPAVYLIGHIDTVPGEIPVRRKIIEGDEKLFGRGTVDAKGPFATFVQAVARLEQDFPLRVTVVGAVEEEVRSSKGAHHIAATHPEPSAVIIGEPSGGNGITLGYKGRLLQELRVTRHMTHSAARELSVGDLLSLWAAFVHEYAAKKNEGRNIGFRTLDVTVQKLSVQNDGFQESGELELGFRLGPDFPPTEVEAELEVQFQSWLTALYPDESRIVSSHFVQHEVPAEYSSKSHLAAAFRQAIRKVGFEPRHVLKTGTADMNVLAGYWSSPMVAYGPGDSSLDHTPNEHISLSEYTRSIDVLEFALRGLVKYLS